MKITIFGTGYVGLVTGACLAEMGNHVFCVDVDQQKIDVLNSGDIPIYEPGLKDLVARNHLAGRLLFSTSQPQAVAHGDIQFIAVGTPPGEDGSADLQYVLAAAKSIGQLMLGAKIVVNKSTVPVGTADVVAQTIAHELAKRENVNAFFSVVSNPEFLKEGAAIDDFMRPDRIVLGAASDDAGARAIACLRQLYAPFVRNHDRFMAMDLRSAELTKYAANAMLATRISFMNELANLAEKLGADIEWVRKGIGSDPRIGYSYLYAGCGYGGSCFPKDVRALQRTAQDFEGVQLLVLDAVEQANQNQKKILFSKIVNQFGQDLRGLTFAIWGLSFKPGTDDMREAPSLALIADLLRAGARVSVYDPVALPEARKILGEHASIVYASSPTLALTGSDALVIVTEWKEFRSPNFETISNSIRSKCIFDGRNIYDPALVKAFGLKYFAIGRE